MKSSDPTCGPPNCRPMRGPDGVVSRSVAVAQQSLVELAGGQARQLGLDVDRAGHLNEARCSARTRWARVRTRDRARHRRPGARLAVDPSGAICGSPTGTRQFESGVIVCAKAAGSGRLYSWPRTGPQPDGRGGHRLAAQFGRPLTPRSGRHAGGAQALACPPSGYGQLVEDFIRRPILRRLIGSGIHRCNGSKARVTSEST
jgi:hypothetical protein